MKRERVEINILGKGCKSQDVGLELDQSSYRLQDEKDQHHQLLGDMEKKDEGL